MNVSALAPHAHASAGLVLSLARSAREIAAARECEAAVFLQTYGNTEQQLHDEYGPYDDVSHFVAVFDRTGTAVGTVRLIRPGSAGLKTLVDVGRDPWRLDGLAAARLVDIGVDQTWDAATLAVRKGQARSGLIAAALYHGMLQTLRANRARWIVMMMDTRARRVLDMAGLRTDVLPGARPAEYLGSAATVPLWGDFAAMLDGQRVLNPEAYRLVALGTGLDGIRVAAPNAFVLGEPGRADELLESVAELA